ncbi:MAG: acyl-CoA dehydrogenase family protein [Acidimicrobiales bacterium]
MDFRPSDEHTAFQQTVRDFARSELAPHVEEWDMAGAVPVPVIHAMGDLGLFGLPFPEEWGGGGGDFLSMCLAIEEIGRVDQSVGITLSAGVGLGATPIFRFGSDQQRGRWLPDLLAGRALAAFGLTEPDAGSDAGATKTQAIANESGWTLNGSKAFITNSGTPITSVVTVTAKTADNEISSFVVPSGTVGLDVQPAPRKLGWHASDTHDIALVDCHVPTDSLLGEKGRGYKNFLSILDDGRIAISALAVGCGQACLDHALKYAKERVAFGGPIGRFQAIAFALADLSVAVENARNLTYKAAWCKDTGQPVGAAAAMAKLYSTEAAVSAARTATQVFGGSGFMEESAVARFYRDSKILEIGEGTSEIQRLVIARGLGLPVR